MSPDAQGGNELRHRLRTYLSLLLAAALITTAMPAIAAPSSADKMAEARRVKAQVDALNNRVSIADESYLQAADKHSRLLGQTQQAAARVKKAQKRLNQLESHLDTRANDMYRNGPLGFLDVLLGTNSFDQFARTWDILKQLSAADATYISQTKNARAEFLAAHAELASKEQAASRQVSIMAGNRRLIQGQLAERQHVLIGVEAQVAALQAQEAAAARAAAAAAQARYNSSSGGGGGGGGSYPAPSIPAHGNVVDYARSRLGLPYVWAASGPGAFDCSGLTMWCYARIGISLPHSSAEQINSGQRVSRKDLQPGDLVFFGSPIHHVGMYVGSGEMIEAPHSGANVRIASMDRPDYAGACRP